MVDVDGAADRGRAADRRRADATGAERASGGSLRRRCRWCSRTRTGRSTRARRSAPSSRSRWRSTAAATRTARRGGGARDDGQGRACARISYGRYPHMFSGGQRQRIAIARALMLQPARGGRRRAGVRARRLDPGAGAEPDDGSAGRVPASPTCSSATTCRVVRHIAHDVLVMYLRPVGGAGAEGDDLRARRGIRIRACCWRRRPPWMSRTRQAETIRGELPSPLEPPPGAPSPAAARTPMAAVAWRSGRNFGRWRGIWWRVTTPRRYVLVGANRCLYLAEGSASLSGRAIVMV